MSKKKPRYRTAETPRRDSDKPEPSSHGTVALRETIESIVVAFVLAFLFRTFEAEAFVIPTGSMSPSLQGEHKDVHCTACGYRFRTSASTEGEEYEAHREQLSGREVIAGMCPMCRQTMLFRNDGLPTGIPGYIDSADVVDAPSYPGDRILVNKYGYGFSAPKRWDVVVFKFPGNGEMNYIKRLVGLSNEVLQVFQGDIFIRPNQEGSQFKIESKPANKVHAMLQPVHDTDYDPTILYDAGWPLRWSDSQTHGWQVETNEGTKTVHQTYHIAASSQAQSDAPVAWLRYQHLIPDDHDWLIARRFQRTGKYSGITREEWIDQIQPQLITDFNPYNAFVLRGRIEKTGQFRVTPFEQGMQWVGDLSLVCDAEVQEAQGELLLDLVEAGKHFTCQIDLHTGVASLLIDGQGGVLATAQTPLTKRGSYRLQFANVDDQLLLWVDDDLIPFEGGVFQYDADKIFGGRENAIPQTSEQDLGDLSPVGVGARGASLTVNHLEVLRDIYYISASSRDATVKGQFGSQYHSDYIPYNLSYTAPDGTVMPALKYERQLFRDPSTWKRFLTRRKREFTIEDKQYFVMGDNSPASLDCRLWKEPNGGEPNAEPGGSYLDARLMTGEAVCVFWPHSWGSIPGLSKLPGFPNFWDMRLVR